MLRAAMVDPQLARPQRGLWGDAARRLRRNRPAMVGLFCIVLFAAAAILAPLIAPYDPYAMNGSSLDAPSLTHLFGTDLLGRDIFSRVLYGAQISLFVGVGAVAIALVIGGALGAIAGGFGGRVDGVIMRTTDVFLSIPSILLAIGIVTALGRGMPQLTLAIAVSYAPTFARLLRGSLLALREATDRVSKTKVRFRRPVELFGCPIVAALAAWIMVCFTAASLHTAAVPRDLVQRTPEARMFFGLAPDRRWLQWVRGSSLSGPFARPDHAFDRDARFILNYATRRKQLEDMPALRVATP